MDQCKWFEVKLNSFSLTRHYFSFAFSINNGILSLLQYNYKYIENVGSKTKINAYRVPIG